MGPLLEVCSDGEERQRKRIQSVLADHFNLSSAEREKMLESGRQTVFTSRVGWAMTYLTRAGLLERPSRGVYRITERGLEALQADRPINNQYLDQFSEFTHFRARRAPESTAATTGDGDGSAAAESGDAAATPEELIEHAFDQVQSALRAELLDAVKSQSPEFFEGLVLDLLIAMGYGGSRSDAAARLGRSGDEGVDGVIREDRLGLDKIYVQAKRYESWRVGRPEVQAFVGALHGKQAVKGVFLTTASFTPEALDYAASVADNVVLIDGEHLASLMISHGVGVSPRHTYQLMAIDRDYFAEADAD